jgi:outer membrane protein TolC
MKYHCRVFTQGFPFRLSSIFSLLVCGFSVFFITGGCAPLLSQSSEKTLPFRTAIELALKNSPASGISRYDMQKAQATAKQSRDFFLPSVVFGSGLGFSYGFPLSLEGAAPSIFNVNIQGGLLNFSQRENVKAARTEQEISANQSADRRNDVILETALAYMQLDLLQSSITIQSEQQAAATKYQDITTQRAQAGLDSQLEITRAKLAVARTRLDIAQTRGAADQLRLRLSQLTGLPANEIVTDTESIPRLPAVSQEQDLPAEAVKTNYVAKLADQTAEAKEYRARAERRALYPSVDLVGQYAVLARYNNYDQFFLKFQRNNVTAGVAIRFPFINPAQHAAADAANADANKAREEARSMKQQVSSDTLKLQRSVEQLAAAHDVAELEHQLAQADIEAARAKIESGQATLKDEQNARVTEHQRYTALLSSSFDLDKVQIQLLRQLGNLEKWALGPTR